MERTDYQKGFSLIEMLVVIAIIAILVAIALPNRTQIIAQAKVTTAANFIIDAAKETRQKSISVNNYQGNNLFPSYGLSFDTSNATHFIRYVDCKADDNNSDTVGDVGDIFAYNSISCVDPINHGIEKTFNLNGGVRIKSIEIRYPDSSGIEQTVNTNLASVQYLRPEPTVWISGTIGGVSIVYPTAKLIVTLEDTGGITSKTVVFLSSGLIYIQ